MGQRKARPALGQHSLQICVAMETVTEPLCKLVRSSLSRESAISREIS